MRFHERNQWFHASEFLRACQAVAGASCVNWLDSGVSDCKYVQLYVDQRTKDFIFRDTHGNKLTHEQVYALFPSLRDDVKIVSVGVRPYPE